MIEVMKEYLGKIESEYEIAETQDTSLFNIIDNNAFIGTLTIEDNILNFNLNRVEDEFRKLITNNSWAAKNFQIIDEKSFEVTF